MEPRQEAPSGSVERTPIQRNGYESGLSVERPGYQNPETTSGQRVELGAAQVEVAQVAMPSLPTPVVSTQGTATSSTDGDAPIVANDDDLIEKEWVDKAKKILAETKDDPYRREREVSKLQIEYIRRRYGREIGDSGD